MPSNNATPSVTNIIPITIRLRSGLDLRLGTGLIPSFNSCSSVESEEKFCGNGSCECILGHTRKCDRTSSYEKRCPQIHSYILRSIVRPIETSRILSIGDANVNHLKPRVNN